MTEKVRQAVSLLKSALPDQLPDSPHPSFRELWRVTISGNLKNSQLNVSEAFTRETGSCAPLRAVRPDFECVSSFQRGGISPQLCSI